MSGKPEHAVQTQNKLIINNYENKHSCKFTKLLLNLHHEDK